MKSKRIKMIGCYIDNLSMDETVDHIESFIRSGQPHQHAAVNVDKLVKASSDESLRKIINDCALVSADGMPVVWASRLLGKPLKERVTGVDLFEALLARAAKRNWRVFLLGAQEEVLQQAKSAWEQRYPGLRVVGCHNGYWSAQQEQSVVDAIAQARPDILAVAITSPRKEYFLGRYQAHMQVPFAMGVGGTFDIAAGKTQRAPLWMRNSGLEWFYRFLQEPRRMFMRYFVKDMFFFWLLIKEAIRPNR